ncbi:MAG: AlkA N-terminal domain-containing protein [Actinomycetota bacterium]
MLDEEACYAAASSKDARFDGSFITAVVTTGIYCRPSCPAITPKRGNVRFYRTAAAAQAAGFRACKRCRPDAAPGSAEWSVRADVVGRAMRMIDDGVVDREGVFGLAQKLGYSERHLTRVLTTEVGAGPLQLARAHRVQTARILLESTSMPATEIAFAAGFGSIRQFNETMRMTMASTPSEIRARAKSGSRGEAGTISLRLPFRSPMHATSLFEFLGERAIAGVEHWDGTSYSRVLSLPHSLGAVRLAPAEGFISASLKLADVRDLSAAVQRCRRMLDLDADPLAIAEHLSDDSIIGPTVRSAPGVRIPGYADGTECAVRAIIGQQVSVSGARSIAAGLSLRLGRLLPFPDPNLTHAFPTAEALSNADSLPMPVARANALRGLCAAIASGEISVDAGADRDRVQTQLMELKGIGPWTAAYIAMRALGDPDVFLSSDLGVRKALESKGLPGSARNAEALSLSWKPWRSYANRYLWMTLD